MAEKYSLPEAEQRLVKAAAKGVRIKTLVGDRWHPFTISKIEQGSGYLRIWAENGEDEMATVVDGTGLSATALEHDEVDLCVDS